MNGESLNIQKNNLEKLKQLFSDIFSEGKIDMEKFKCGTEHFKNFEGVEYKRVSKVSDLKY
jgi:hypothetical protein